MPKLVISDISADYGAVASINNAFNDIETAIENTLSRDGTSPNNMLAPLDMGSNDVNNVASLQAQNIYRQGQALVPSSVIAIDGAVDVGVVPAGNIASNNVQDALEELDTEKMPVISTPVTGDLVTQAADGSLTKAGWTFTNVNADVTASDEELNYSVGVTSAIQTQLNTLDTNKLEASDVAFRGALVYKSGNQTITTGTGTDLTFDTESYDTDIIHDNATNNERLTVPTGVSRVRLSGSVSFAVNGTGYRLLRIFKNGLLFQGSIYHIQDGHASNSIYLNVQSAVIDVTGGDYFTLNTVQTSGGNLDILAASMTWFAMEIIE